MFKCEINWYTAVSQFIQWPSFTFALIYLYFKGADLNRLVPSIVPGGKASGTRCWPSTPIQHRGLRKGTAIILLSLWAFMACYKANYDLSVYKTSKGRKIREKRRCKELEEDEIAQSDLGQLSLHLTRSVEANRERHQNSCFCGPFILEVGLREFRSCTAWQTERNMSPDIFENALALSSLPPHKIYLMVLLLVISHPNMTPLSVRLFSCSVCRFYSVLMASVGWF
jgi:hypothetical protein